MGTRSDIIVQRTDGKWARIYCHWDGYVSHNGHILYNHYNSQKMAEKLVKLGDLSSLGEVIGIKHSFDWQTKLIDKYRNGPDRDRYDAYKSDPKYALYSRMCLAYGRDRGETGVEARVGDTLSSVWPEADTWTEFTYVWSRELGGFTDGAWWVGDPDEGSQTLKLLAEVIAGVVTVTPAVKAFGGIIGKHQPGA